MSAVSDELGRTILADIAAESYLWDTSVRLLTPVARAVVRVHRYQMRVLRGRNAIAIIFYVIPLFFLLLAVVDIVLATLGDFVGVLCLMAIAVVPILIFTAAYRLLEAVYEQVTAEEEVFPEYDNTGKPFNEMGVELAVLLEFVQSCGGPSALEGLSTTEVCERFLKPMTSAASSSYCDFLLSRNNGRGDGRVRSANVFISHAWRCDFLTVVDAITLQLSKEGSEVVIWFDLFSNNQHGLEVAPPFGWWCHTFLNAIRNIGRTVMIIQPWDDPIPLTRAWCLWELFCTARTKSRFEIAMGGPERRRFTESVTANPDLFLTMVSRVDAVRSESWIPEDKERIHEVVKSLVGFNILNRLVVSCLRNWYIRLLEDMVRSSKASVVPVPTLHLQTKSLGMLYQEEGLYSAAEMIFTEYESICAVNYTGEMLPKIQAAHLLAKAVLAQGRYNAAKIILEKCRLDYKASGIVKYPEAQLEYLQVLLTLARVYILADRPERAALILQELDTNSQGFPGYTPLDAAWYQIEYADVYISLHPDPEDEDITENTRKLLENSRESVTFISQQLGQDHPYTLEASRRLGVLMMRAGNFDNEVQSLLEEAVDKLSVKLGELHPNSLSAMHSLGKYSLRISPRMAVRLLEKCRRGRIATLGKLHPSTLEVIFDVGSLSDYAALGFVMSLIALCATAAVFAVEVSVLNGFKYGIDAFSSAEQSVMLGMAGAPLSCLMTLIVYDSSFQVGLRRPRDLPFLLYWYVFSLSCIAFIGGIISIRRVIERDKEFINILFYVLSVYGGIAAGIAFSLPVVRIHDIYFLKPRQKRRTEVMVQVKLLDDDSDKGASHSNLNISEAVNPLALDV